MNRTRGILVATLVLAGCAPAQPTQPTQPTASPTAGPSAAPTKLPGAMVSGVVYDDQEQPLAGVTVEASQEGRVVATAETGADGRYSLSAAAGAYEVIARKAGLVGRRQNVSVGGQVGLNFGGWEGAQINPFHLSTFPEIEKVELQEEAPGGPLSLTLHLSEPLDESSRINLLTRLELRAQGDNAFLKPQRTSIPEVEMKADWDEAGKRLSLRYEEPYLASGAEAAVYTLRLTQAEKETLDPVTREREWEDMRISDRDGHALGRGRADFSFVKEQLSPFPAALLADKTYGYSPEVRRWNLTHTSSFTFSAAADTQGPGLTSVGVDVNELIGGRASDIMTLRFTEPMRVVKNREETQFTRLDPDRPLKDTFVINVSKFENGRHPEPLTTVSKIQEIRFSRKEPELVYVHFPPHSFKDMKWVEVTLGEEARDPANNRPDASTSQVSGFVTSVEE